MSYQKKRVNSLDSKAILMLSVQCNHTKLVLGMARLPLSFFSIYGFSKKLDIWTIWLFYVGKILCLSCRLSGDDFFQFFYDFRDSGFFYAAIIYDECIADVWRCVVIVKVVQERQVYFFFCQT